MRGSIFVAIGAALAFAGGATSVAVAKKPAAAHHVVTAPHAVAHAAGHKIA